ncbi:extracellular solute-binding protein [Cohnella endophytica]|uniref:Extracellular solute-binding protein n=1 Tax=Cohnella endophytica TaxID=2419778 RepID=A0A494Y414_9BACL|nr:extracellular solute-binding protein [Cohnella endophytica]RKP55251.1 extracellular solute-binding protein [Cohnella endophytica]
MARRKSALVFLLLCMMAVILSPWAKAPSPASSVVPIPEEETHATVEPADIREISYLKIEVAMDPAEFNEIKNENARFVQANPDITVELTRVDPGQAYSEYKQSSEMKDSMDIMLLNNEWVKEFASSGYLLPADAAFVGKALAEQFDALTAPLKWNGYLWGVPLDMDPYVLVWNMKLLREWLGEDVVLPLTVEQWSVAAEKSEQSAVPASWLAIDGSEPFALLAWLENAGGHRSDELLEKAGKPWEGAPFELPLSLLERHRASIRSVETDEAFGLMKEGTTLVAVVPYSTAADELADSRSGIDSLELDHQSWRLPWIWPRGRSFVISADSDNEEAAYRWIAGMTGEQAQLDRLEQRNRLPVFRSFYDSDRKLNNLLPGRTGQGFPNQAPLILGPDVTVRLQRLSGLWERLFNGEATLQQWITEWNAPLAADG